MTPQIATDGNLGNQRVICAYVDNSFEQDKVTEALRQLIRGTGMNPNSFKADVYTCVAVPAARLTLQLCRHRLEARQQMPVHTLSVDDYGD